MRFWTLLRLWIVFVVAAESRNAAQSGQKLVVIDGNHFFTTKQNKKSFRFVRYFVIKSGFVIVFLPDSSAFSDYVAKGNNDMTSSIRNRVQKTQHNPPKNGDIG